MTLPNIDTAQSDSSYRDVPNVSCGFARSGDALKRHFPDLVVSKQNPACGRDRLCPPEASGGESESRVCLPSLRVMRTPVKRPHAGQFLYDRRNGIFCCR